jgi:hypothetical protein
MVIAIGLFGAVIAGGYFVAINILFPRLGWMPEKRWVHRPSVDPISPKPLPAQKYVRRPEAPERAPIVDLELQEAWGPTTMTKTARSVRPTGSAKYAVTSAGKMVVVFDGPGGGRKTDYFSRAAALVGYSDEKYLEGPPEMDALEILERNLHGPPETDALPRKEGIGPHGFRLPRKNLALTEGSAESAVDESAISDDAGDD